MPRQIIDTESSRPAYVRRRTRRHRRFAGCWSLLVAAVWFLAQRAAGQETRPRCGNRTAVFAIEKRMVPRLSIRFHRADHGRGVRRVQQPTAGRTG